MNNKIKNIIYFVLFFGGIAFLLFLYRTRYPKIEKLESYSPVRVLVSASDNGKTVALNMTVQGMAKKIGEIKKIELPKQIGLRIKKMRFSRKAGLKAFPILLTQDKNRNNELDKNDSLISRSYELWTKKKKNDIDIEMNQNLVISDLINKYNAISFFMDLPEESFTFFLSADDDIRKIIDFEKEPTFEIENLFDAKTPATYSFRYVNNDPLRYISAISEEPSQFVRKYSFFSYDKDKNILFLKKGLYLIKQTVVIPKATKVVINPGVTLILSFGTSFVSYSPVIANGTKDMPIRVKAEEPNKPFGVFALANEGASGSTFEYFNIESGKDAYINGIFFSGMFSAYHNDVIIKNSSFTYAHGDDAVNLKYSNSSVYDSYFYRNRVDAIDEDFMSGEIIGNTFIENNGDDNADGLDLSGSTTIIKNNYIFRSKDKCISVGEGSRVEISNNFLEECNIGIASKDSSGAYISNSILFKNNTALDAYLKKPFFKGGKIVVNNSIFLQNGKDSVVTNNFPNLKSSDNSNINIYYSLLSVDNKGEDANNAVNHFSLDFLKSKNWSLDNTFFVNVNPVYLNNNNDFFSIGLSDYTLIDKLR